MNDHTLAAEYINAGYNHKTILSDVSVTIPKNKISVILGANGCGKSTLLKTFARLLAPQSGQMILDGKNVSEIPSRQMAKMAHLEPLRDGTYLLFDYKRRDPLSYNARTVRV